VTLGTVDRLIYLALGSYLTFGLLRFCLGTELSRPVNFVSLSFSHPSLHLVWPLARQTTLLPSSSLIVFLVFARSRLWDHSRAEKTQRTAPVHLDLPERSRLPVSDIAGIRHRHRLPRGKSRDHVSSVKAAWKSVPSHLRHNIHTRDSRHTLSLLQLKVPPSKKKKRFEKKELSLSLSLSLY
jgi:hypothetical protein